MFCTSAPEPWERFLPHLDHTRSRFAQGLVFIFAQCIIWIGTAVITQKRLTQTPPFIMTYIGMSLMALLLPFELWNDWRTRKNCTPVANDLDMNLRTVDSFALDIEMSAHEPCGLFDVMYRRTIDLTNHKKQKKWNHKKHILAALQLAPAMFMADWGFNYALRNTSVASATVIVSSQNVIVFILALLTKIEGFCWIKLGGVLVSMVGIALTALHDKSEVALDDDAAGDSVARNAILGDFFAFLAAITYGIYSVQVRLFCPQNEELYKMQLLLGYIGLVVLLPCLPYALTIIIENAHSGVLTWSIFAFITIKGLFDFLLTDYFLFRAVILTSATIATVGLGLTIPMAFVSDLIFRPDESVITVSSVVGAVCVGVGFISVSLSSDEVKEEAEKDETKRGTLASIPEEEAPVESTSDFVLLPPWVN